MGIVDFLIVLLSLLLLCLWGIPKAIKVYIKSKVATISAQDLSARLANNDEVVLIDVRRAVDFDGFLGHIAKSINLPLDNLSESLASRAEQMQDLKNVPVVVIDDSGFLPAFKAVEILKVYGFTNISLLEGGVILWIKNKLPTTKIEVSK